MGMQPSFDVHDLLDALKDSVGLRADELIGSVGIWFANQFNDQSAEEKHETMLRVRPVLRRHGFDICDSEDGEQVGCDYCENCDLPGRYMEVPESKAFMRLFPSCDGYDAAMCFKVNFNDDYAYSFDVPVKYCPFCGRRLDG